MNKRLTYIEYQNKYRRSMMLERPDLSREDFRTYFMCCFYDYNNIVAAKRLALEGDKFGIEFCVRHQIHY